MNKRLLKGIALALALSLLCGAALAEVRTTGNVWLRNGPGLSYDAIASIDEGKTLGYLGQSSVDDRGVAWYKVETGDGIGWVSSRYSELVGESEEFDEPEAPEEQPEPEAPEEDAAPVGSDEGEPTDTPSVNLPSLEDIVLSGGETGESQEQSEEQPAPDAGKRSGRTVELSGYYLDDLVEAVNDIGLISYRQVESEAPFQYYDDAVIVAGNRQVENIVVFGEGYSVYGVTVGMDAGAAKACLNAAGLDYQESLTGFTYEHKATEASLYTDDNGHDSCINVWLDDNDAVSEIDWSTYTG